MNTVKTLDDKEVERFLTFMKNNPTGNMPLTSKPRNYLLALLMIDAGLRVGELVRLQWPDIPHSELSTPAIVLRAETTKTKQSRTIPATSRLILASKAYAQVAQHFFRHGAAGWVFPSFKNTNHISERQIAYIVSAAGKITTNRSISPHTLRHTFATRLLRNTSTVIVQRLLGHKSLNSTQIYTHPNSTDLRDAIDKME